MLFTVVLMLPAQSQGPAHGITVVGDYAYVAAYDAGLQIMDVSNPAEPVVVGKVSAWWARRVRVSGEHAYVAADKGGLKIINIQDPKNPVSVGEYNFGFGSGICPISLLSFDHSQLSFALSLSPSVKSAAIRLASGAW